MQIFKRMAIVPFELAIAILSSVSGLTSLFHVGLVDPINQILPYWEALVLNVALMTCGLSMIWGICKDNGAVEAAGLWLLNTTITARFVLYGYFFHFGKNFFLMGIFNLAVVFAGFVRLHTVRNQHILLKVKDVDVINSIE